MAYLVADATGDLTAAATWKLATAVSTSLLDSQAANTTLTASFVSSSAFTPGALTIQGLCVKVASRTGTTGTMSVRLANAGVAVAGTTVTINVADLPAHVAAAGATNIGCPIGWVYFKFAASVVLIAATAYTLQATTSSASQVNLFRDATAANWSRLLVTTTTQAPVAGDSMFTMGGWTAAGVKTDYAVTIDSTLATDYGSASTTLASIGVGKGGTLTWGIAAATAYLLRVSGLIQIWQGGIYRQGVAASPVPSGSSATLEFDCVADGDFGFVIFDTATREFCGSPRTAGKAVVQALLNTDEAIGQTVLGVDTDTGWLNGDRIVIGSTTRARSESEVRVLSGAAGATSVTVTVGLTNAHSGTSPTQGEVVLLTRNVTIRAVTLTATWYLVDYATATFVATWTAFEYFGGTAAGTVQFRFQNVTPATFTFCAWANFERAMTWNTSSLVLTPISFTDCVWWQDANPAVNIIEPNGYAVTMLRGAAICGGAGTTLGYVQPGGAATLLAQFVRFVGGGASMLGAVVTSVGTMTIEDCNFHASGANVNAILCTPTGLFPLTVRRSRFWRTGGIAVSLGTNVTLGEVLFEDCYFIGNNLAHIGMPGSYFARVRMVNCDFESEASFTTAGAVQFNAGVVVARVEWHNCRFSQTATKHLVDINNNGAPVSLANEFHFVNTLLGGTSKFSATMLPATVLRGDGAIGYMEEDGISGAHKALYYQGSVQRQAAVFNTAAPSEEMLPTRATTYQKLKSFPVRKPVASGQSVTFSVWVRKSAAYTGNQPRIVIEANGSAGWKDTTVAYTAGADTWAEMTLTVGPATEDGVALAYVDCDGTVGSVYVDDWSATVA